MKALSVARFNSSLRIPILPQSVAGRIEEIIGRPLRQFFGLKGRTQRVRVAELLDQVRLRSTSASLSSRLSGGEGSASRSRARSQPSRSAPVRRGCRSPRRRRSGGHSRPPRGPSCPARHDHRLRVTRPCGRPLDQRGDRGDARGDVREQGPTEEIFATPTDSYTRELLDAVPDLRPSDYPGLNLAS